MRNGKITILAIAAIAVTVGTLWLANRPRAPGEASWADVVAEAEQGGYRLISTDALWKAYRDSRNRLLLVDTRQEWEYRSGHIKGAVNFPMEPNWLARWRNRDDLGKRLGRDKDRSIVFY